MPALHVALGELLRRGSRRALSPRAYLRVAESLNDILLIRALGWSEFRRLKAMLDKGRQGQAPGEFHFPALQHPLQIRPGTSDACEASHTVVRSCYGQHSIPGPVRFIIDAGANIGDSACWFLSKYPEAHVLALEVDAANFDALQQNTRPYGDRVTCLNAGLWVSNALLRVRPGDSTASLFVEEVAEGPADCQGLSPATLLERFPAEVVDIFKVDIEGGEVPLFQGDVASWLPRCRMLFVDVHSEMAARLVETQAKKFGFRCASYRELMVLKRLSAQAS